jgi:hypothetical protein
MADSFEVELWVGTPSADVPVAELELKTGCYPKKEAVPVVANCRDESLVFPLDGGLAYTERSSTREWVTRWSASSDWFSLIYRILVTSLATR